MVPYLNGQRQVKDDRDFTFVERKRAGVSPNKHITYLACHTRPTSLRASKGALKILLVVAFKYFKEAFVRALKVKSRVVIFKIQNDFL